MWAFGGLLLVKAFGGRLVSLAFCWCGLWWAFVFYALSGGLLVIFSSAFVFFPIVLSTFARLGGPEL